VKHNKNAQMGKENNMAAGIEDWDVGYTYGDNWHRKPQYIRTTEPLNVQQIAEILPDSYEICPCYGKQEIDGIKYTFEVPKSNYVWWPETQKVVAPNIGDQFHLLKVHDILHWLESAVLEPNPSFLVESAGTLLGGRIRFISVATGNYQIKGDESPMIHRLMITDPIGLGSITIGDALERVVCRNTHQIHMSQAKKAKQLINVRHKEGASDEVKVAMLDMSERHKVIANEKAKLDLLADTGITVAEVDAILESLFPAKDENGDWKKGTRGKKKQEGIKAIFESGQEGFLAGYDKSAYAFFNAITQYLRDEDGKGNVDVEYDNMFGNRAGLKDKALESLLQLV
jgi:hypothetical protein